MGKREPFDPTDPYDIGCEMVRKAVLRTLSNTILRMPPNLVGPDRLFAQVGGTTMALACLIVASAQPGRELQAVQDILGMLPQMVEDAKAIQADALASQEKGDGRG